MPTVRMIRYNYVLVWSFRKFAAGFKTHPLFGRVICNVDVSVQRSDCGGVYLHSTRKLDDHFSDCFGFLVRDEAVVGG